MKVVASLVPYVAVLVGMYLFHSAWLAILLYHAGILVFLAYRKPVGLWRRMWAGAKSPLLVPGILACALAAPVVYFMWPWLAVSETILLEWMLKYGLTGWSWLLLIPYFSIIHPVLEEIHWRGISPEDATGLYWQDFMFAGYHVLVLFQLMHAPWLLLVFAVLVGSSVFWRWANARFGGYGLSILTHAVADAAVVVGVHLLLRT
ncbi:MAG: CPBP family glutamic-type intramembrane protease [Verrucomicrobiota bacterium]